MIKIKQSLKLQFRTKIKITQTLTTLKKTFKKIPTFFTAKFIKQILNIPSKLKRLNGPE